jgi:hypothetical protein
MIRFYQGGQLKINARECPFVAHGRVEIFSLSPLRISPGRISSRKVMLLVILGVVGATALTLFLYLK